MDGPGVGVSSVTPANNGNGSPVGLGNQTNIKETPTPSPLSRDGKPHGVCGHASREPVNHWMAALYWLATAALSQSRGAPYAYRIVCPTLYVSLPIASSSTNSVLQPARIQVSAYCTRQRPSHARIRLHVSVVSHPLPTPRCCSPSLVISLPGA
ncbi:hypothetical protein V8C35DRAFT_290634 [Trichoderma chlorosporum]